MTPRRCVYALHALGLLLICLLPSAVRAEPRDLGGRWYRGVRDGSGASAEARTQDLPRAALLPIDEPKLTGGTYYYEAEFTVVLADTYVVDFKNSSTIGRFRHSLFAADAQLLAQRSGGIESREENPFLLRHGRELRLAPGRYRLVTQIESAFLLAPPEPFIQPLAAYRRDIKSGNALGLVALGVLCGLGLYYAALALSRRRIADIMYVLFIVGNLLYNGSALLVFSDLFGIHWFYLVSMPILFSNMAYVVFVMALLEIRPRAQPLLHRTALAVLALLAGFAVVGMVWPNWSLELDRYGVALLTTYGLIAAVVRARHGHSSARYYLVAASAFFLLGGVAISRDRLDVHMLTVEHLGLVAVVVEAALLALVLAHQFSILHSEKTLAERRAREGYRIAYRDALTGLPNRYSLEDALARLPTQGSLTFIDLDGLKHYNDEYGHSKGDELLRGFAEALEKRLGERAALYRLSGDEFAVLSKDGEVGFVSQEIESAIGALQRGSFKIAGASFGSVFAHEDAQRENLKHIADTRMYEHKRIRRASGPAEWLRPSHAPSLPPRDDAQSAPQREEVSLRTTALGRGSEGTE